MRDLPRASRMNIADVAMGSCPKACRDALGPTGLRAEQCVSEQELERSTDFLDCWLNRPNYRQFVNFDVAHRFIYAVVGPKRAEREDDNVHFCVRSVALLKVA